MALGGDEPVPGVPDTLVLDEFRARAFGTRTKSRIGTKQTSLRSSGDPLFGTLSAERTGRVSRRHLQAASAAVANGKDRRRQ